MDETRTRQAVETALRKYNITNKSLVDDLMKAIRNGDNNLFTWYEQNVGAITPIMADQLKQAEEDYAEEWIKEAFTIAVNNNARKWSYIKTILENWRVNGYKNNGREKPISEQPVKVELPQPRLICGTGQKLKAMAERKPDEYLQEYRDHLDNCHLCGGASNASEVRQMVHNLAERMRV